MAETNPAVPADLLELLRCPITRSKLTLDGEHLVSELEQLRYPLRDGIPVLLPDEAQPPAGRDLAEIRARYAD